MAGDPLAPHSLRPAELKLLLDSERAETPFLAYRDEAGVLAVFVLSSESGSGTWTLGRGAESDLAIEWDAEVSGLHAELELLAGELTLIDDGLSTNGTFLNSKRVGGRNRLRDEDRLRVGRTTLVFRSGTRKRSQSTVVTAGNGQVVQLTDGQHRVLVALCRPYQQGDTFTTPATNQQIADEVFLSVDHVKAQLRALFAKFELTAVPQNEKRTRLAECALQLGLVTSRDYP
jgi:pSer/pThr/pTyr-binding forkhead associated (FHA) protein